MNLKNESINLRKLLKIETDTGRIQSPGQSGCKTMLLSGPILLTQDCDRTLWPQAVCTQVDAFPKAMGSPMSGRNSTLGFC